MTGNVRESSHWLQPPLKKRISSTTSGLPQSPQKNLLQQVLRLGIATRPVAQETAQLRLVLFPGLGYATHGGSLPQYPRSSWIG
jgi:hypothetical protein